MDKNVIQEQVPELNAVRQCLMEVDPAIRLEFLLSVLMVTLNHLTPRIRKDMIDFFSEILEGLKK